MATPDDSIRLAQNLQYMLALYIFERLRWGEAVGAYGCKSLICSRKTFPDIRITARSIRFCNSLTFPGQV